MSDTLDNKEIIRLGTILEAFNNAATEGLSNQPAIGQKVLTTLTQEKMDKMMGALQNLAMIQLTQAIQGETETGNVAAVRELAIALDIMAGAFEQTGHSNELATYIPAEHKSAENAEKLRQLGMKNIAGMWLK